MGLNEEVWGDAEEDINDIVCPECGSVCHWDYTWHQFSCTECPYSWNPREYYEELFAE